jgi:acetoacetyl-CoA synthetase
MDDFIAFARRSGLWQLGDDTDLERFAVQDYRRFWQLLLCWSELLAEGVDEPACDGDSVEHAVFFPNLRLSYAENLLEGDDEQTALIVCDDAGTTKLSRLALRLRTQRAAAGLQRLGIGEGDHVVAIAYNDADAVVACLATLTLGATFSSASPDMAAPTILSRFGQLSPQLLLTHTESRPGNTLDATVRQVIDGLATLRAVVTLGNGPIPSGAGVGATSWEPRQGLSAHRLSDLIERSQPLREWQRFGFNHPLFILFSSGTTGAPKCIIHGAGGTLLEHLKEHRLHCDLRSGETLFFQTSSAWMMWNWQLSALASKVGIVLNNRPLQGAATLWNIVSECRVDVFGTSPSYLKLCESVGYEPREHHDLSRMRSILSTGSILYDTQFDWVERAVKPVPLQSISGGTDIVGCFMLGHPLRPVVRGEAQCRSLALDVTAVDAQGVELPPGEVGELVCRQPFPSRPLGFHGDEDGTRFHRAYFAQNEGMWTHGDLVAFGSQGTARLHGRSDGTLNVRGIRIGTSEIYAALQDTPELVQAMAVEQSLPGDVASGRIVLLVVLAPGVTLSTDLILRLRRQIAGQTSAAHVPGLIIDVDALPVTHSGKLSELAARDAINRRPIRNRDGLSNPECLVEIAAHPRLHRAGGEALAHVGRQDSPARQPTDVPPKGMVAQLQAIWAEVLEIEGIKADDDFFELGGDSLIAVAISQLIEEKTGRTVPISMLAHFPTIAALAAELERDDHSRPKGKSPVRPLKGGSGMPLFVLHSMSGNLFEWHDLIARLNVDRPLVGIETRALDSDHVPATSIEVLAADYVALIREHQPEGPYSLMGYSLGGLLAHEIAVRLERAGKEVDFVGLIDTYVSSRALTWPERLQFVIQRSVAIGRRIVELGAMRALDRLAAKAVVASKFSQVLAGNGAAATGQGLPDRGANKAREPVALGINELPTLLRRIQTAFETAHRRYRPPSYGGELVFFRARERRQDHCDPLRVWRRRAASVIVVDIPGDHRALMRTPDVDTLAAEIGRYVGPAESVSSAA